MPVATISLFDIIKDSGGTPQANVTVSLSFGYNAATDADGLILPSVRTATTDGTGKWTIAQVIPTDLISPSNTVYLVETPFRTYEVAPQSGNGASQQSTAANVIVNNPLALAPYTGLIGGTLTVTGLLTANAGVSVPGGGVNIVAGETGLDTLTAGALLIADNTATSVEAGSGATPFALQGDVATRSLTVLASGPYVPDPNLPVGGVEGLIWDKGGAVANVKTFGVKGDGQTIIDGVMNGSTAVLTSVSAKFKPADAGKLIVVPGAGVAGAGISTTILSYQSATQVTLAVASSTAIASQVEGNGIAWATDDLANENTAINTLTGATPTFTELYHPTGLYGYSNFINLPQRMYGRRISGAGMGDNQTNPSFGGTILMQFANNTPLFKTANENMSLFCIEKMTIKAGLAQASANTAAVGLMFSIPITGTASGWAKSIFAELNFNNWAVGMGYDPAGTGSYAFWGNRCRDLKFDGHSISAINFTSPTAAGGETNFFDGLQIYNGTVALAIGPAIAYITLEGQFFNLVIEDWNSSSGFASILYCTGGGPVSITGIHMERCTLQSTQSLFKNGNSLSIRNYSITATMAPGGGNTDYLFNLLNTARLTLEVGYNQITQTNGTTALLTAAAGAKCWIKDWSDRGPNAVTFPATDAVSISALIQYDNTFYAPGFGYKADFRRSLQTVAFTASYTPNPLLGEVISFGSLTGNVTVNAVAAPVAGQVMTFIFIQDVTGGRTVSWAGGYLTAWTPSPYPFYVSTITLLYDGANWQQIAGQVTVGHGGQASFQSSAKRSRQGPTETVLVSGVDANAGELVAVTLTAARVVGAPLNPSIGQRLTFTLVQGGIGGFAVTWNAVFKKIWSDAGNATGARSSISFYYDGGNWNQDGAQALYV